MEESKSQLRAFQDQRANEGWRIRLVPLDDSYKPMMIQTNWYAVAGALMFVGGIGLSVYTHNGNYIYAAFLGFVFALAGLLFTSRRNRRGWKKMEANCVDREIREVRTPAGAGGVLPGTVWDFRLLCKFDYAGTNYTVTPVGFWRTFATEHGINEFLSKEISSDGRCFLYVNPRNPLETELAAGDIAEKLLH